MGKRKERRLAAKSNAGRRVKLDLFVEPSGDLGGSSVHDEVGGDIDLKHQAGLPNSPTSSGPQPENPLLLLGQYSDDELDEGSKETLDHGNVENSSADNIDQVERPSDEGHEDMDVNAIEGLAAEKVKQQDMEINSAFSDALQYLEGCDTRQSDATASDDLCKVMDSVGQNSIPGTDVQVVEEVTAAGWKIVMHEESNQCYYWNTETGETSWEVPEVLSLANGPKLFAPEKLENASVSTHELNPTLGVEYGGSSDALGTDTSMDPNLILRSKGIYDHGPRTDELAEGQKGEAVNDENWGTDQSDIKFSCGAVNATSGDKSSTAAGSEKYTHDTRANGEHKLVNDISLRILKQSEYLLERLKSLKASKGHLRDHDWMDKYILEVEIRLSDVRALLSCGPSLLPFWVHSERQLKRLENIIDDEVGQLVKSEKMGQIEATDLSSIGGKDKIKESMRHESEADANENKITSAPENPLISSYADTAPASEEGYNNEVLYHNVATDSSFALSTGQLGSGAVISEEVNGTVLPGECTSNPEFHAGEDVDMDVDMEVEDAIPAGDSTIRDMSSSEQFAPPENLVQPNQSVDYPSLASDDGFTIPPPPDEEWIPPPPPDNENEQIPPPPPDNEQVPPPPPDEPPEPSYPAPPSYTGTRQPLSYAEFYSMSYPDSSFEYYGHMVAEVPNNNIYGHADASQVSVPHPPLYYEAVPNTYAETAPIAVNPVEAVAYYGLQDGTVPPVPVVSSIKSSQLHTESGPVSYDTLAFHQIGSADTYTAGSDMKVDGTAVRVDTQISSIEAPSTSTTIEAPATISAKESVAAALSKASKSKVLRPKKRTAAAPSLRSNKKVSSLVDKWKAAKEELHEDEEDEPESAYEILEKKRQREIEEWRAKQIASGEARDNANFQPLGGDWRERVKRRRAQKASEPAETPPEAPTDRNEQPDLVALSKNLPTGWQAYWDESSKQVYYGNSLTSETTWTRPTR